jgi:hypothetical protein
LRKGNLLIILAVVFTKELQTITNAFILNLAISDFLIAAMCNSIIALMLNSSMNPIFYALTNPKFQKGYLNIFDIIMSKNRIINNSAQ